MMGLSDGFPSSSNQLCQGLNYEFQALGSGARWIHNPTDEGSQNQWAILYLSEDGLVTRSHLKREAVHGGSDVTTTFEGGVG